MLSQGKLIMFKKGCSSIKPDCTLVRSLVLVCLVALAFSAAWATQTYYASKIAEETKEYKFTVVNENQPKRKIEVQIPKGAIGAYLDEENLEEVEITVKVEEELVSCEEDTHYHLKITFGPSGAFFVPELELTLTGDYVDTGCDVWLFDENGEALPGTSSKSGKKITFFVPHFSEYDFDDYDYGS